MTDSIMQALLSNWRKSVLFAPEGEGGSGAGGGDTTGAGEGGENGDGGKTGDAGGEGGGKPPAGEGTGGEDDDANGSGGADLPEVYEFDHPTVEQLSDAHREAYNGVFKEMGLTQDQVNQLLTVEDKIAGEMAEAAQTEQEELTSGWIKDIEADKELSGDWELTQKRVAAGVGQLAGDSVDDFLALLDDSGLGNHPVLVKAFSRLGQLLTDDKFDSGDTSEDNVPAHRSWYKDTTPESKRG